MTAQQVREMLELLRSINAHIAHIEELLSKVISPKEAVEFVEWSEPER